MSDADFKLREFPDWPDEQVIETARMLYALRPFKIDSKSELQWNSLAREAFDFLDNLHKASNEIARRRTLQDAAYRRAETRTAEAKAKLPEIVPFDKAVLFITREERTKRALPKFKRFVLSLPDYFGGLVGKPPKLRTLNAQIKRWRKTGIPRREVLELQAVFEGSWPRVKSSKAKVKKRKPWPDDKRKQALSNTAAKKLAI
jgi:hypothetical protein